MTFRLYAPSSTAGWTWVLATKDGPIARSPYDYATEVDARSHIATAKTAMKGARFAKVEVQ